MRPWALIAVMLLPGLGLYSAFEWHDYLTRHEHVAVYGVTMGYRAFCCVEAPIISRWADGQIVGGRK